MKRQSLRIREQRLPNGMSVLAIERRFHPVVTAMVWYRVGSRDELTGQTGVSHFLEHMMFKGTRRIAKGEIDWITARLGGSNNAFTDYDYTAYYFNFARDRWETSFAIEAERMRGCLLDLDELGREKKVVLEEMRMGEDDPWRDLAELVSSTVYSEHPYHHPVIGWKSDVMGVTREQMLTHYRRYYSPERAVVVVAGDIDSKRVFELARRHFGSIPRGDGERRVTATEPMQRGERRVRIERDTAAKRLMVAYRGVKAGEKLDYALDVLAAALASGRSSRLHVKLVKQLQLATVVSVENEARREPGLFSITAEARDGVTEAKLEQALLAELEDVKVRGVKRQELERARQLIVAGLAMGQESVSDVADRVGRMAVLHDWRYVSTYEAKIAAVTVAGVREAACQVLDERLRTVGWSVPVRRAKRRPASVRGAASRALRRIVVEPPDAKPRYKFTIPRPSGPTPVVRLRYEREVLTNGLTVLVARNPAAPTVSLTAYVDIGIGCEPASLCGIENLTGSCLEEGSRRFSGDAMARTVEDLGGYVESGPRGVHASGLAGGLTTILDIMADMLRAPAFPKAAVDRVREEIVSDLLAEEDDLRARAFRRLRAEIYGKHPLHRPADGTVSSVKRLTRQQAVEYHARWYAPHRTYLAIAGDVDPAGALSYARRAFGGWRTAETPVPEPPSVKPARAVRIFEKAAREQTHLAIGHLGIRRSDPNYYALLVLDHVFGTGPGFTDRLSRRIRDQLGLTYGVNGNITSTAGREPGIFACYLSTEPGNAKFAEASVIDVIRRVKSEPPTEEEVRTAKDYLIGSYPFSLERNSHLTHAMLRIERYGLGADYFERFPSLVESVKTTDVARVAREYLKPEACVRVAVGPRP